MTDKGVDIEQGTPLGEMISKPICKECGVVLEEEQTKCPQCGAVIEEVDEVEESLIHWGDEIVYPEDVCNT